MEKLSQLLSYAVCLVLYLDPWAWKCCIVICIVIVNAIWLVQRSIDRSRHRRFSGGVLTNFSKFTGKHLCQSLFFKRLYYRFFLVNFPKFVGALFLQNTFGPLLLQLEPCQISMIDAFWGNSNSWTVFTKKPISLYV